MAVSTDSGLTVTSWVRAWKGHGQIADGYAVEGPQLALSSEVKFEDYVLPPPLLPSRSAHQSQRESLHPDPSLLPRHRLPVARFKPQYV